MLRVGVLQGAGDERTEVVSRAFILLDKVQQWVLFSVHIMDKIKQLRLLVRRQILPGLGLLPAAGVKGHGAGRQFGHKLNASVQNDQCLPRFQGGQLCRRDERTGIVLHAVVRHTVAAELAHFFQSIEVVGAVHHREVGIGADGLRFGLAVNGLQLLEALQHDESADVPGAPGCHHAAQR